MSTYYGLSAKTLRDLAATSPTHAAAIREHFATRVAKGHTLSDRHAKLYAQLVGAAQGPTPEPAAPKPDAPEAPRPRKARPTQAHATAEAATPTEAERLRAIAQVAAEMATLVGRLAELAR